MRSDALILLRPMLVAVVAALTVLAMVCLFFPQMLAGAEAPRDVPLKESEDAVRKVFAKIAASTPKNHKRKHAPEWMLAFTTWVPNEWPPTGKTVWTRYAYGLDVALDGASGVSEPVARLERGTGEVTHVTLVPMAERLKRIATHPVRPHSGWNYTQADEQRVLLHALALTAEPTAEARGTVGLISYFQSWKLGSAEIAAHVASKHKVFFEWLDRVGGTASSSEK